MSAYTMDAGECVAAAIMAQRVAARKGHDWETVFASIPQHFTARMGSAVDDAWLIALATPCPYCRAGRGEECREDCSSRWDEGR